MATFTEVEGTLKNLIRKQVTVKELVDLIKSIDSLKTKNALFMAKQSSPYEALPKEVFETVKPLMNNVSDMLIDFTYQRFLKLRILLLKLDGHANGNFMITRASVINARIRNNGDIYIWDGLRRAVLCGLKDIWEMPVLALPHDTGKSVVDQRAEEARDFSAYNGRGQEAMKKEEVWKADYVAKETDAIEFADLLESCNLDVLKVLGNDGWSLGGFAVVYSSSMGKSHIDSSYFERASNIIQKGFPQDKSMKGYLLAGLAQYLLTIETLEERCQGGSQSLGCEDLEELFNMSDDTIIEALQQPKVKNQEFVVSPSQSNKQVESASFNVLNKVLRHNITDTKVFRGCRNTLLEELGLDADNFFIDSTDPVPVVAIPIAA